MNKDNRLFPELIARELVGVQPMNGPSGGVFNLKMIVFSEVEERCRRTFQCNKKGIDCNGFQCPKYKILDELDKL